MTGSTFAFVLGLGMLVSFPALAGGRDAHRDHHYYQHSNKHHRHDHGNHRHCRAVTHQHYRGAYERHGRYTRSHPVYIPGYRYGYSGAELVIVYHPRAEVRVGY